MSHPSWHPAQLAQPPTAGLYYRPWLRTLTWLLFYAFSVFSFVIGCERAAWCVWLQVVRVGGTQCCSDLFPCYALVRCCEMPPNSTLKQASPILLPNLANASLCLRFCSVACSLRPVQGGTRPPGDLPTFATLSGRTCICACCQNCLGEQPQVHAARGRLPPCPTRTGVRTASPSCL